MDSSRIFATLGVIILITLAGCTGGFGVDAPDKNESEPGTVSEPATTEASIEANMSDVQTVQVNSYTVQNSTIKNQNQTTITDFKRQQIQTRYNFTANKSVSRGVGQQQFLGTTSQYQFERYYSNGTEYSNRLTAVQNNTTETGWQVSEVNQTLEDRYAPFADSDLLELGERNETLSNNSTIVYQINVLNNTDNEELENLSSLTPLNSQTELLDTYAISIYVNNTTHRLEYVQAFAYANLTQTELAEFRDVYEGLTNQTATGDITYGFQTNYSYYNDPVNITIPENATEAETPS